MVLFTMMLLINGHFVFAAGKNVTVSYDPKTADFTKGQKSVVYIILSAPNDAIAAAKVSILATGGVKIIDILSPLDSENKPFVNTKIVDKTITEKLAKETILVVSGTADLPGVIKIPVVVTGEKAGNLQVDTKESQIIDANGNSYNFAKSKAGYMTFSGVGRDTSIPPTPTPLPATSVNLNLTMKFQGITSSGVKSKTISGVKVQLVQGSGQAAQYSLPQYITVTMDEAGLWHGNAVFPNVKPGKDYALLIKGPKHLQKRICENDATESAPGIYICTEGKINLESNNNSLDTSGVTEMIGDVGIQDSILNSYDLSFIQNTIRKTSKSSGADADVNYDGVVNKTDYDLLIYSLVNTSGQDQR